MQETDFGWALAKMRDGYKVRRASRPDLGVMWMDDGVLVSRAERGAVVSIHAESILAYDWELADAL